MKPSELPFRAERTVVLDPIGFTPPIGEGDMVRIVVGPFGLALHRGDWLAPCAAPQEDPDVRPWLEAVTARNAYAAEVLRVQPQIVLRVLEYDRADQWAEPLRIGLDDIALEQAARMDPNLDTATAVAAWLAGAVLLVDDEPLLVIATGGSDTLDAGAFRLVGHRVCVDVRLRNDRLQIERIVRRPTRDEDRLWLIRGTAEFLDGTSNAALSPIDRAELRRLSEADNAYLAIWREYNDLERQAAATAAKDIGWAEYDHCYVRADGAWEFVLVQSQRSDRLRERVMAGSVGLEAATNVAVEEIVQPGHRREHGLMGTASVTASGTITIRPDTDADTARAPRSGRLSGAFTLDRVRIERRTRAESVIAGGETRPVRQLARILADQTPEPVGRLRRQQPLSDRVLTILGGTPTPAQIEAIDIAVNSQDLVLIQGPPGTGKTRVVAAIQARLAEIADDDGHFRDRRVLLSSYQHDAVANLIQAADDGRLPAVKLGRRLDESDEAYLDAWAHRVADRLEARYADVLPNRHLRAQQQLADRVAVYQLSPSDVHGTVELLNWIANQGQLVGADLVVSARELARTLRQRLGAPPVSQAQARILRGARALRTTAETYLDDGKVTAREAILLPDLVRLLGPDEEELLESAARGGTLAEDALAAIARLQMDLVDRVLDARARSSLLAAVPEVDELLALAKAAAERTVGAQVGPVERAVERFRRAVVDQPLALRESVRHHTQALAATCQQAVSGAMRDVEKSFETVIIDEAARANPLDLMIPMSLAKGRIVLVGDHRQLPQLLDDALQSGLSTRHDPALVERVLSRSLFERLFRRLRDQQALDPVRRVVTLDRQFRTHPLLGRFVSEQFYEPHGEHVHNGIEDPMAFQHGLERYGDAACGWIDVPHDRGRALGGDSLRRPAEARVVVAELSAALAEDRHTTFGIVTFYSGQETEIWAAMRDAGLAVAVGNSWALNRSVAGLFDDRDLPRVRIGTVDAFQGREFDVVYLSTTRSEPARPGRTPRYGFLVLPNRLCVAMSRQRKLLIAVGDAAMFTSDAGREAVPSLAAFFDLTGGRYGFRRAA